MSNLYQASTGQAYGSGPMDGDADKRPTPILEISDPTKPSGLVMTQIRSGGSHVMYHPVFKAYTDDAFDNDDYRTADGTAEMNIFLFYSQWYSRDIPPA